MKMKNLEEPRAETKIGAHGKRHSNQGKKRMCEGEKKRSAGGAN